MNRHSERGRFRMSAPIVFLMGTMFLTNIGFGVILPTLPFLASHLGATPFDMGLAISFFAVAQLLSSPIWGILSDRVGRKPIIIIGVVGYGVVSALLGIVPNLPLLLVLRFFAGAMAAAVFPAAQALAADHTLPKNRARILGYMGSVNNIGFIIGPPVGAFLAVFGVNVPFVGVGMLAVLNGMVGLWLLPRKANGRQQILDGTNTTHTTAEYDPTDLIKIMRPWAILPFLCASLFGAIADSSIASTLAYFITSHLHSTPLVTGWAFMVNGGTAALIQVVALPLVYRRFGETPAIILGFFLGTMGYVSLGLAGHVFIALLSVMVISCCSGLVYPIIASAISIRTPRNSQGRSFGVQQAANSTGRTLGPMVAGWLFTIRPSDPYFLASVLMAGMATFFLIESFRKRNAQVAFQSEDVAHDSSK
ncbi:MFS transporter [Alicyclobacillus dauci]|uniref:MFS transporter n=1 Tax=Alicyclobacillus dauci TaxID=1475485 RepID=A0ABY6Z3P2_9BACL|nr:MFS transporter [Alicyclobacillus dauci]WAH37485.1 MFS transporter [Alicyclobacillus dauci]